MCYYHRVKNIKKNTYLTKQDIFKICQDYFMDKYDKLIMSTNSVH